MLSLCLSWHSLHALELKGAQAVVKKWVDDYWKDSDGIKGGCIHNEDSLQWSEAIYDQEDARILTKTSHDKPDKSKAYTLIFYRGCALFMGARPSDGVHTCMGILHKGQLSKGFCTDTPLDIEVKNNLLVILATKKLKSMIITPPTNMPLKCCGGVFIYALIANKFFLATIHMMRMDVPILV